ncbi:MAG: hypothetical protein KJ871_10945 [Alphaproteobacteria bacterium]|nr:hypothetical protein [Alphaproteobacteria bacterium]MBU2142978.1 hypothetical protein [Alphaproteobacteria bacterium]MBU2196572.1 hypothetical protein [Alphaproteobacteria bacterium]
MLVAFAASFLLQFMMQWKYSDSNLLILDDNAYIPNYLLGKFGGEPTNFLPYKLLEITAAFKSVVLIKISSLVTLGMITALFTVVLDSLTKDKVLAIVTGLAFTTYTIALEQGFFVTGSHPSLGMVFALGALAVFMRSGSKNGAARPVLVFVSALLALLSSVSSPTTLLVILAPPLWVLIAFLFHRSVRNLGIGLALTIWPAALRAIAGNTSFHYAKAAGWTELTPGNFVQNIGNALAAVFLAPLSGGGLAAGLYLGLFAMLASILVLGLVRLKRTLADETTAHAPADALFILLACALLTAILVLGPSLVVTAYYPRYAWPAYLFGALLLAAPLVWLSSRSGLSRWFTLAIMTCLIVLNTVTATQRRDSEFLPYLKAHQVVAALTRDAAPAWPSNAQVVMLLPKGMASPSQGVNHWSTDYLRMLSNHPEILALIGPDSRVSGDPFVEKWSRDGKDYWSDKNGRLSREHMKGLEPDRPTFVYRYNASRDALEPVNLAFLKPSGARFFLAPGQALDGTKAFTPAICAAEIPIFNWLVTQQLEDLGTAWTGDNLTWAAAEHFVFDSTGSRETVVPVSLKAATPVRLALTLSPYHPVDEVLPNSSTSPPMPLRSPAINIYHMASGFHVTSTGIPSIVSGNPSDAIRVVGIEGCFYQVEIGGKTYPLDIRSLNGKWTLGRGLMDRYWQGGIDWQLETAPQ